MKYAFVLVLTIALSSFLFAGTNPAFDSVKSLAGNWKGIGVDGKPFNVTFQVVSGGSTVMERMDEEQMVTMYYPDGEGVMLTHYCMAQNQPRMKATAMSGNTLQFQFVDATNLASVDAGHMHSMKLTVVDADHIEESWDWSDKGKTEAHAFKLERVK